jgi:hypothetical protein
VIVPLIVAPLSGDKIIRVEFPTGVGVAVGVVVAVEVGVALGFGVEVAVAVPVGLGVGVPAAPFMNVFRMLRVTCCVPALTADVDGPQGLMSLRP